MSFDFIKIPLERWIIPLQMEICKVSIVAKQVQWFDGLFVVHYKTNKHLIEELRFEITHVDLATSTLRGIPFQKLLSHVLIISFVPRHFDVDVGVNKLK